MEPEVVHGSGNETGFCRKCRLLALRLVEERGVTVEQAARDRDLHENVLRRWVRELAGNPRQACPEFRWEIS